MAAGYRTQLSPGFSWSGLFLFGCSSATASQRTPPDCSAVVSKQQQVVPTGNEQQVAHRRWCPRRPRFAIERQFAVEGWGRKVQLQWHTHRGECVLLEHEGWSTINEIRSVSMVCHFEPPWIKTPHEHNRTRWMGRHLDVI